MIYIWTVFFNIILYNLCIFIPIYNLVHSCSSADRWLWAVSASEAKFFLISLGLVVTP